MTRVLYVTAVSPDHLSSVLWDGLQEVLGEENVVDAVGCPWLHAGDSRGLAYQQEARPGARALESGPALHSVVYERAGLFLADELPRGYDLLVLHASFNRDHDAGWAHQWRERLRPGGKVAYVEGWDGARDVHLPPFPADAFFRKEIDPAFRYPYPAPVPLTFAAPARWFESVPLEDDARPYDVVFVGNPDSAAPSDLGMRWRMLAETFRTRRHHASVVATRGLGVAEYWRLLRSAKLALCPAAADGADSLRTYEAVAAGAVPVFVGYPDHVRDPWFPGETCFACSVPALADHLDEALGHDQTEKRRALWEHARRWHTTRARAERVLREVGLA